MTNTDREARLPAWARMELQTLRMRLDEARQRIEEQANGVIFTHPYDDTPHAVARFMEPIMLHVGDDRALVRVTSRGDEGPYIEVSAYSGRVSVMPQASNVVNVWVVD